VFTQFASHPDRPLRGRRRMPTSCRRARATRIRATRFNPC